MSRGVSYISRLVAAVCSNSRQQNQHATRLAAAAVHTHGYNIACLQHQQQAQYVSQSTQQSWAVLAHAWQPSTPSCHALSSRDLLRLIYARHISSCSSCWHDSSSVLPSSSGSPAGNSRDSSNSSNSDSASTGGRGKDMGIVFTCAKCDTRSIKAFSRHSYEKGLVLIRCPGCQSLHLIADHLGWFGDTSFKIDEYMAAQGQTVKRTSLDPAQQQQHQADQLTAEDMAGWSKVQQLLSTVAAASGGQEARAADEVQDSSSCRGSSSSTDTAGIASTAGRASTGGSQQAGHAAQAATAVAAADSGVVQVSPEDVEAWVRVQQQQQGPKGKDS